MHENRLLMNETKTEFLLIGTKQQLDKVNVDHVKVGNGDTLLRLVPRRFFIYITFVELENIFPGKTRKP